MHRLVPGFILQNLAEQRWHGRFQVASLFVDISGFSVVTDTLLEHGQHGAEVLAGVMSALFEPLVASVYEHKGFIAGYAGDGFTALFPFGQHEATYILQHALTAAWHIQQQMLSVPTYETPYGSFHFSAKAGMASGFVQWGIVSGEGPHQHMYYFMGQAIDGCTQAENYARGGDLIITETAWRQLPETAVVEPVSEDGAYHRVTAVTSLHPPTPSIPISDALLAQATAFHTQTLLTQRIQGEFRQTLSAFIRLPDIQTHAELVPIMRQVFRLQQRYGGFINRIDFSDHGCHLVLFWGAPIAFENDIERALQFVLDCRAAFSSPIRAGITYRIAHAGFIGSQRRQEYTCYGRGVNLAARFVAVAPPGTIWLDKQVAVRAKSRFDIVQVGEYAFKGFAEKQSVWQLLGRRQSTTTHFYWGNLIGRRREILQLHKYVGVIDNGRYAGVVSIIGDAGIGKSRLLFEFENLNASKPFLWLRGRSNEILRRSLSPFRYCLNAYFRQSAGQSDAENKQLFNQLLDDLIAQVKEPGIVSDLDAKRSFLGALIGLHWPDSLYEQINPELRFENTLNTLEKLFQAESLRQPLILVLEDVHWLDDDSSRFLHRLTRNLTGYPIAILMTGREELSPDLLHETVPQYTMKLPALKTADTGKLVKSLLGREPAPALVNLLQSRTDGNPFFLEQIVHYLKAQDLLSPVDTRITKIRNRVVVPTDVRTVLVARLDNLSPPVKEVVQTAAVLGREFDVPVLSHMLSGDEEVASKIETAAQETIWFAFSEVRYVFNHALLRDTAYDMQLQARRCRLHVTAAMSLQTLYAADIEPHLAEIAYHYEAAYQQGEAYVRQKAIEFLSRAGRQAADNYENRTAITYFNRALALTRMHEYADRYTLLLAREAVYALRGNVKAQEADITAVKALVEHLDDDRKRVEVSLRQALYERDVRNDFNAAIAHVKTAVKLAQSARDVASEAQAYLIWGAALLRKGEPKEAQKWLEKSLQLACENELPQIEASSRQTLSRVFQDEGDLLKARQYLEAALTIHRHLGNRMGEGEAVGNLANLCWDQKDYADALTYYRRALRIARETGNWRREGITLGNLGLAYIYLGNYADADTYLNHALAIRRALNDRHGECFALHFLMTLAHYQGDQQTALQYGQQALEIATELGQQTLIGHVLTMQGFVMEAVAQLDTARHKFQEALALRRENNQLPLAIDCLAGLAMVALSQQQINEAQTHTQEILTYMDLYDLDGVAEPFRVYLVCYRVLQAINDHRAPELLQRACKSLQAQAAQIVETATQRSFLHNVPAHREILTLCEAA